MTTTYKDAGVDINLEEQAIKGILRQLDMPLAGHFCGLVGFGDYHIAMCCDGIGTKALVAEAMKKYDTVGIDMVAMNVNDMICIGAKPMALVDYLAVEKIDPKMVEEIAKGIAKGAKEADVSVIGGETATMPEVVKGFDLSGSCMGIVDKDKLITGEEIKEGDVVVALPSSGIHSNGLTLARKVLDMKRWGDELLKPTKIYVREILGLLEHVKVHGMVNITGGGMLNLKRVLPKGLGISLEKLPKPQKVFLEIQKKANLDDEEMYKTFNMGVGFCIILDEKDAGSVNGKVIGRVVCGEGVNIEKSFVL